jgi:hypothetical protein
MIGKGARKMQTRSGRDVRAVASWDSSVLRTCDQIVLPDRQLATHQAGQKGRQVR